MEQFSKGWQCTLLVLGNGVGADLTRPLMDEISQSMEAAGYQMCPERRHGKEAVGLRLDMDTGTFAFPVVRACFFRAFWGTTPEGFVLHPLSYNAQLSLARSSS